MLGVYDSMKKLIDKCDLYFEGHIISKEMLLQTDMRISEIAELVGYPDQNYFTRMFKKYTGLLPSEYRLK